jgi:hypothetical protein
VIRTPKLIGRHFIGLSSAPSLPVWVTSRWSNIAGADVRIIRLREGWRGNNDRGQSHRGEELVHVTSPFRMVGDLGFSGSRPSVSVPTRRRCGAEPPSRLVGPCGDLSCFALFCAQRHADPQVRFSYWLALRCSEPPEKAAAFA